MNGHSVALATCDLTLQKLAPVLPRVLSKPAADPRHFRKGGDVITKLRLLPVERAPDSFWSSAWCFYEIGVGAYDIGRLNFGGVQFVMFPDNAKCGSGRYRNAVLNLLGALNPQGRKGFFLESNDGPKGAAILCGFHFCLGEFAAFPVEAAAEDLAWLVRNTLNQFAALP